MPQPNVINVTRRSLMRGAAGLVLAASVPRDAFATAPSVKDFRLIAKPAKLPIVGRPYAETTVWAYNETVPGPEIRLRQGERVKIAGENRLPEGTDGHLPRIRLPQPIVWVAELNPA